MERFRRNKGPLLLPVLCLAAALLIYLVVNSLWGAASVARQLSLGQQYLTDMNYNAAILAFNNAIRTDPVSKEAHIGLAKAYAGTGEYQFAGQMLEDLNQGPVPDEEISDTLIDIYTDAGEWERVIRLIRELIDSTDRDEYYDLLQQVLAAYFDQPHSYGVGTDQRLVLKNGQVLSAGSNSLGQLGVALAAAPEQPEAQPLADAGFDGTAARVWCAGRTSLALDEAGNLWAAGENRWGQMGLAYADGTTRTGWTCLTDTGDVAAAAGTTGHLLVLHTDGSLWQSGSETGGQLEPVSRFATVIQLESSGETVWLLSADGGLYTSSAGDPYTWTRVAEDVLRFGLGPDGGAVWLAADGGIGSNRYSVELPEGWTALESGRVQPDFAVRQLAQSESGLLLTDAAGTLYLAAGGQCTPVSTASPVEALYRQGEGVVLELRTGEVQYWADGDTAPAPLA